MFDPLSSSVVRIAGYASLAFACVILLLGMSVYWATRNELAYDLDQRILTDRVALIREGATPGLAAVVAARTAHGSRDMRYALLDANGRRLAGQAMTTTPPLGWSTMEFIEDGVPDPTRGFASRGPDGRLLVVGADPEAIEQLSANLFWLFGIAFGLIAAIGVGGALLMGRLLSRRLGAVSQTAEAIIAGDLQQRIPVRPRGDEFDRLAATLNHMLDRIEGLLDNLRQVSGDIAHDLRTPLTRLRQGLELALSSGDNATDLRDAVARAIAQSDEALALFAGILAISEVEAKQGVRLTRIDLSQIVTELADSYQPSIEDDGRVFHRSVVPGVTVSGSRELLAQMIANLLDNALRHTAAGVAIALTLALEADGVAITIADHGSGIPPGEQQRVLERFARLERSRSTPGHGLGLSLVAAVARAHGGTVRLADNIPGVKAIVTLPVSAA